MKLLQEELQIACQKIKNEMNITEEITIEDEIFNSKKWDAAWTKKCFLENSKKLDYIEKSRRELYSMWQTLQVINYAPDTKQFRDNPLSYSFFWEFVQEQKQKFRNVMDEFDKEYDIIEKGLDGENYIQEILDKYCYKYPKMENVVLKVNDELGATVEIDAIIIGDHEVFVCEIKNYGQDKHNGQILEISMDGTYRLKEQGKTICEYEKSPSKQNIRQYQALDKLLISEFPDWNINVVPLVIMANTNIQIKNYSPHQIIKPQELFYCLEKNSDIHFTIKEREKIEKCIKKYILPERKFETFDISNLDRLCENLFQKLEPYVNYNER